MNNNFYEVRDFAATETGLTGTISYNAAHPIFEGHFPGNAIVPGVCTMQLIGELISRALHTNIRLFEAPGIKYLQLLTPDAMPEVMVSWTIAESIITANAVLKSNDQPAFKMTARYSLGEKEAPQAR